MTSAFNYAFAIFTFGCVISGVVWLGIMEAQRTVGSNGSGQRKTRPTEGPLGADGTPPAMSKAPADPGVE